MRGETILLVDDEQHIVDVVEYVLKEHGFTVKTALDGDNGLRVFRSTDPDLVLLDLNLPGMGGIDLFHEMRRLRPAAPIIMLTSRTDETDRVLGLELGADDYVTKPFSPRELAARVRAVLRRTGNGKTPEDTLRVGAVALDPTAFTLLYHGEPIAASRLEYRLMECLLRNPARVFPRAHLIDAIYDGEAIVTDRCIDAQIKRLRKKFQAVAPDYDPIQTVYGIGYKLSPDLEDTLP
jgi:DNA-binding response OmpR family regulator